MSGMSILSQKKNGNKKGNTIRRRIMRQRFFAEKPTPEQIMEKYKGMVYQRRRNVIPTKSNQHIPKVKSLPM